AAGPLDAAVLRTACVIAALGLLYVGVLMAVVPWSGVPFSLAPLNFTFALVVVLVLFVRVAFLHGRGWQCRAWCCRWCRSGSLLGGRLVGLGVRGAFLGQNAIRNNGGRDHRDQPPGPPFFLMLPHLSALLADLRHYFSVPPP